MSIPVSAMHADVKDGYLSQAERQIESDPAWTHGTAGRDARSSYLTDNFFFFTVDTNTATTGSIKGGGYGCSVGPVTIEA